MIVDIDVELHVEAELRDERTIGLLLWTVSSQEKSDFWNVRQCLQEHSHALVWAELSNKQDGELRILWAARRELIEVYAERNHLPSATVIRQILVCGSDHGIGSGAQATMQVVVQGCETVTSSQSQVHVVRVNHGRVM